MTAFSKRNMTTGDSSQIPDLICRPSDVLFCILERPSLWGLEAVHVEYVACLASAVHWSLGVASFVSSQWQSVGSLFGRRETTRGPDRFTYLEERLGI